MIEQPTVLVVGAGASVHVGYPLGRQLVNNLCRRGVPSLPERWSATEAGPFLQRLSRGGYDSIDAFLESVPEQAELGKYLLASEMKSHEDIDRLFSPRDAGWYRYLFDCLLDDRGHPAFAESELSIVTFNYDRSLEVFLLETLKARFQIDDTDAGAILSGLPIVHVHGSLGQYPETPYQSVCVSEELLEISRQIQIVSEITDRDDTFCNAAFEGAHALLQGAERIILLGFGFHPDNIRRFRFFVPENISGRELVATTHGMGSIERTELVERLSPLGFPEVAFDGHECNSLFNHRTRLR